MASPTEAQAKVNIQNLLRLFEDHRLNMGVNAGNYLANEKTYLTNLVSGFTNFAATAEQGFRNSFASGIAQVTNCLAPLLQDYGQIIQAPEQDISSIFQRLYQYYVNNSFAVPTRNLSFGTPTFSGAIGNGAINRLNLDENGNVLENQTCDLKTARCLFDSHGGAAIQEEIFELFGAASEKDLLKITGSGKRTSSLKCMSGKDAQNYLSNPSFDSFSGTVTSLLGITDWTVTTSLANFNIDQVNFYRTFNGVATPGALKIIASDGVTQNITVRNAAFDKFTPYYFQVAWNRQVNNTTGGTLTFTVGNVSTNVTISAQTGWQILQIPIGKNNWLKNFDLTTFTVSVSVAGLTGGALLVDDIIIAPFQPFDGSWYAPVGSTTPFQVYDQATWTDAFNASDSIIQQWLWRAVGRSLPSAMVAPTGAVTAALGSNGNPTNGTHAVYCTFVGPTGVAESSVSPTSNVVTVTTNQQITLTTIPLGPVGTTARKLYMTIAGNTGNPKYAGLTINDNSTTTGTINVADGSLGANAPAGVTFADPSIP